MQMSTETLRTAVFYRIERWGPRRGHVMENVGAQHAVPVPPPAGDLSGGNRISPDTHSLHQRFTGDTAECSGPFEVQGGAGHIGDPLLARHHGVESGGVGANQEEAVQITAVRFEKHDFERID